MQLNAEGLEMIDRQGDPLLHLMAIHNHLLFLVDLGHYVQAKRSLFENRQSLIYKNHITALRFVGLRAGSAMG
jgi:hypothetical protein